MPKKRTPGTILKVKSSLTINQMLAWQAERPQKCYFTLRKCVDCQYKKKHNTWPLCAAGFYKTVEPIDVKPKPTEDRKKHSLCMYCARGGRPEPFGCNWEDGKRPPYVTGMKNVRMKYNKNILKIPVVKNCKRYFASNTARANKELEKLKAERSVPSEVQDATECVQSHSSDNS